MKFILDEKYILDERFILNEAGGDIDDDSVQTTSINSIDNDGGAIYPKGSDWETLISKAESREERDQIWNAYYTEEWGQNADKVKNLGEGFVQEVLGLGFTEQSNPFIAFLIGTIADYNFTTESYGVLHNAYVLHRIDSNDLRGKGELSHFNLIFCKDLYTKRGSEIEKLLETQDNLLRIPLQRTVPEQYQDLYSEQPQYIYNVFYNKNFEKAEPAKESSKDEKIIDFSEIRKRISENSDKKIKLSSNELVADKNVQTILRKNEKLNLMAYLIDMVSPANLEELYKDYNIDIKQVNYSQNSELKKSLNFIFTHFDITGSNLKQILTSLNNYK